MYQEKLQDFKQQLQNLNGGECDRIESYFRTWWNVISLAWEN